MHVGSCVCGLITVELSGEPEAMGYCHCRSCRTWSGGLVNAFSLWKPAAVRVRSGQRKLAVFRSGPRKPSLRQETALSDRTFCSQCGGHLLTLHTPLGLVDVFPATLPSLAFKPSVHVNYAETVLPMKDGLPKLKDFPREFGGSGETVSE